MSISSRFKPKSSNKIRIPTIERNLKAQAFAYKANENWAINTFKTLGSDPIRGPIEGPNAVNDNGEYRFMLVIENSEGITLDEFLKLIKTKYNYNHKFKLALNNKILRKSFLQFIRGEWIDANNAKPKPEVLRKLPKKPREGMFVVIGPSAYIVADNCSRLDPERKAYLDECKKNRKKTHRTFAEKKSNEQAQEYEDADENDLGEESINHEAGLFMNVLHEMSNSDNSSPAHSPNTNQNERTSMPNNDIGSEAQSVAQPVLVASSAASSTASTSVQAAQNSNPPPSTYATLLKALESAKQARQSKAPVDPTKLIAASQGLSEGVKRRLDALLDANNGLKEKEVALTRAKEDLESAAEAQAINDIDEMTQALNAEAKTLEAETAKLQQAILSQYCANRPRR